MIAAPARLCFHSALGWRTVNRLSASLATVCAPESARARQHSLLPAAPLPTVISDHLAVISRPARWIKGSPLRRSHWNHAVIGLPCRPRDVLMEQQKGGAGLGKSGTARTGATEITHSRVIR